MGLLFVAVLFPVIALAIVSKVLFRVLFFGRVGGALGLLGFVAGYFVAQQQANKASSAPATPPPATPPVPADES